MNLRVLSRAHFPESQKKVSLVSGLSPVAAADNCIMLSHL